MGFWTIALILASAIPLLVLLVMYVVGTSIPDSWWR